MTDDTPQQTGGPDDENPILTPAEQLPITFFDHAVLAVRRDDGGIYLAIRDLCDATTLRLSPQLRRIRSNPVLREGLARFQVATAGGSQAQDFLELERVPTWLLMINTARTTDIVRERLAYFQRYIIREVYAAFSRLTGLPEASHQIEDLDELRRMDTALAELAERQQTLETSQDKARQAWRDLTDQVRSIAGRVAALEHKVDSSITRRQRGYIYQLVQAWAEAKVAQEPRLSRSAALQACWATIKRRYQVARYEDISTKQYDDCVAFVRNAYYKLTGSDLDMPEQSELPLE
ncbi:MAG: phage antirepressor N-terminal domain-containing protein [Chloroflexaceae bacterium]